MTKLRLRLPREEKDRIRKGEASRHVATTEVGGFEVTTAYRRASTPEPSWYYETFVWGLGLKDERWDRLAYDATGTDHFEVVQRILTEGAYWEQKDDE